MSDIMYTEFQDAEVRDFLNHLEERLKDVKGGAKKYVGLLSAIVYKDVNKHFSDEAGSKGKWKPWSKSYAEHMAEIGRANNKILQYSGKLRQNFKPTNSKFSAKGITWFNDAQTKSGFPYAAAHDDGGGKLPQRDFMWLSKKAFDQISVQTLQFLLDEGA